MSQGWSKIFNRINWLNRPNTNTPLNATNLNAGDSAIDKLDDRIITLDTVKADMQVVNGMVADVSLNSNTGVITVTYKNGSHVDYDTNLEKIAVNFSYDYVNQRLVLTLPDGTTQYVDMSALITQYEFKDSTTIAFSVDSTGKVSASIKNGSITEAMLETGYLANIKVEVAKAEAAASQAQSSEASSDYNAKLSRSYAIGGSGIREGEDADNAMYYYEQAKKTDIGQISSEVTELNSNLDELAFGENAGGKNLFNPKCLLNATYDEKTNTITVSNNTDKALDMVFKENTQYTFSAYIKQSSSSTNNRLMVEYTDGTTDTAFLYTQSTSEVYLSATSKSGKTISEVNWYYGSKGTATFRNFQIEEGTTATPYEPYIPSVKMLAEEVNQQNESLDEQGLINKFEANNLQRGYWNDSCLFVSGTGNVSPKTPYICKDGDLITVKLTSPQPIIYLKFFNSSDTLLKKVSLNNVSCINEYAPFGAVKFVFTYDTSSGTETIENMKYKGVYYNNAIDELKNDLDGLSFSASGTTLSITNGTNTWTLEAN